LHKGLDIPDPRAFPHLHSLFDKLKQTFCDVDIGPLRLSKTLRQYLDNRAPEKRSQERMPEWWLNFQRIAHTLDVLLSNDSEYCLDPVEQLTLEELLARPPMFACVLIPCLVPSLEKLENSEIANIYSEFLNFVRQPWNLARRLRSPSLHLSITPNVHSPLSSIQNNLFPALKLTLEEFASKKSDLQILKQHAAHAAREALENIHIHRQEYVPNHVEFEQKIRTKKMVINSPNCVRFPSITHHHISNQKSNTIQSLGDQPQFHIKVIQTPDTTPDTPADNDEIVQLWLK